jgi:hypothetical protein
MKPAILMIALTILFPPSSWAQHHFRDRSSFGHRNPNISPVTIAGIVTGSVGCGVSMVGFLVYASNSSGRGSNGSQSSYSQETHNTSIAMMGIGLGMVAVGTGLIIAGVTHDKKTRWSLVAPKHNEIGLAYNFR